MKRVAGVLLGLYVLAAVGTRTAEALGMRSCGCPEDCWCRMPVLSTFRWVFPCGHRLASRNDTPAIA